MTDNSKNRYLFSLIRLRPQCKITPTFVDFTPTFMSSPSLPPMTPSFNLDQCHSTPAFMLLTDKKTQARSLQTQKLQFEHRVRSSNSSQVDLCGQEAAPPSNYCQICQQHFKDYQQHTEQKGHQLRWHHNEFNCYIRQLCQLTEEDSQPSCHTEKRKIIKKRPRSEGYVNIKCSPKTTVDNYPKRKTSFSSQLLSFSQLPQQDTFQL